MKNGAFDKQVYEALAQWMNDWLNDSGKKKNSRLDSSENRLFFWKQMQWHFFTHHMLGCWTKTQCVEQVRCGSEDANSLTYGEGINHDKAK